jgi:hypothetical protein
MSRPQPPDRLFWQALVASFERFNDDRPQGMTTVVDVRTVTGDTFTGVVVSHDHRAQWLRLVVLADLSDEKPSSIVAIPDHAVASIEIRYERASPRMRSGFSIAGDDESKPG